MASSQAVQRLTESELDEVTARPAHHHDVTAAAMVDRSSMSGVAFFRARGDRADWTWDQGRQKGVRDYRSTGKPRTVFALLFVLRRPAAQGNCMRLLPSILATALCVIPAAAQETNPFDGAWTASFEDAPGRVRTADVLIKGGGGMWRASNISNMVGRLQPCSTREAPLEVKSVNDRELVIVVARSRGAITGCDDIHVTFERVDDSHLEGRFQNGSAVQLTRK
jgi:hypothetical protein